MNLLEYNFHEIRLKNQFYIVDSEINPNSNCVIAYSYYAERSAFLSELYIWFSPDYQPLSKKDYACLEKYYDMHNPELNRYLNKYKLFANINLNIFDKFGPGEKFEVPSGLNNVTYDCVFSQSKETGLYCFKLNVNPVYHPNGFFESEEGQKIIKLYDAINRKDIGEMRELMNEGADFRYKKLNNLSTPFDAAIAAGCADICEILLQHGADVNQINGYGPDHSSLRLAFDVQNTEVAFAKEKHRVHLVEETLHSETIAGINQPVAVEIGKVHRVNGPQQRPRLGEGWHKGQQRCYDYQQLLHFFFLSP